jgi:hypothetical protein
VIVVALPPAGGVFDVATYTVAGGFGVIAAGSGTPATQTGASSTSASGGSAKIR